MRRRTITMMGVAVGLTAALLGLLAWDATRAPREDGTGAAGRETQTSPSFLGVGTAHAAVPGAAERTRALLERRAGGMTGDRLVGDLVLLGVDGTLPDHTRWMWQASALLELHPELCASLVEAFQRPELRSGGRALVLDLLVAAGHAEAQAALRAALATPAARADEHAGLLVQRLGFVDKPDAETAEFAAGVHAAARAAGDVTGRRAGAFALGAVAGRVGRDGDTQAARALTATLVDEMGAGDAEERGALMQALGNARLPEHVPLFVVGASDASPVVRAGAAVALGTAAGDDARVALRSLLADASPEVQQQALGALVLRELQRHDVEAVVSVVIAGGIHVMNEPIVLDLAVRQPQVLRWLAPALEWLATRGQGRVAGQARSLLAQLG